MNDLEYKLNYLTHQHNNVLDYELTEEESKELQLTNLFLAEKEKGLDELPTSLNRN